MGLIRGTLGDCPCPICLVPRQKQSDYLTVWKRRTMDETSRLVTQASTCSKSEAEALLKPVSLRPVEVLYPCPFYWINFSNYILVENAFWRVQFSDPHMALSFDHMHNYPHGLGGKHFWSVLQEYVNQLGSAKIQSINSRCDIPHSCLLSV